MLSVMGSSFKFTVKAMICMWLSQVLKRRIHLLKTVKSSCSFHADAPLAAPDYVTLNEVENWQKT